MRSRGPRRQDDPLPERDLVAAPEHGRQRKEPEESDGGPDDPRRCGEQRASEERGDRERAGKAAHEQLHAPKQLVHDPAALDQIPHEQEERDGDEDVVLHHEEGPLDHEIEDRETDTEEPKVRRAP